MSEEIRPDYYQCDGQDLFDHFETGLLSHEEFNGFLVGNVIKYVVRYRGKNGLEDLIKAQTYLDRLIRLENAEEDEVGQ